MGLSDLFHKKGPRVDYKYKTKQAQYEAGWELCDSLNRGEDPRPRKPGQEFMMPDKNGFPQWLIVDADGIVHLNPNYISDEETYQRKERKQPNSGGNWKLKWVYEDGKKNRPQPPAQGRRRASYAQEAPNAYRRKQAVPQIARPKSAPALKKNAPPVHKRAPPVPPLPKNQPPPPAQPNVSPNAHPPAKNCPRGAPQYSPPAGPQGNTAAQPSSGNSAFPQNPPQPTPQYNAQPSFQPPPQPAPPSIPQGGPPPAPQGNVAQNYTRESRDQRPQPKVPRSGAPNILPPIPESTASHQRPNQPQVRSPQIPSSPLSPASTVDPLSPTQPPLGARGQRVYVPGQSKLDMDQFGRIDDPEANYRHQQALNDLREGKLSPPETQHTVDDPLLSAKKVLSDLKQGRLSPPGTQTTIDDPLLSAKKVLGAMGQRVHVPGMSKIDVKDFGATNDPEANFKHMNALNDLRNAQVHQAAAPAAPPPAVGSISPGAATMDDPLLSAKKVLGAMGQRAYVPGQSKLNVKEFGGTNDPEANFKHMKALNDLRNAQGQPPAAPPTAQGAEAVEDPLISAKNVLGAMGQRAYVPGQSKLNVKAFGATNDPEANFRHQKALDDLRKAQGQPRPQAAPPAPAPATPSTAPGAATVEDPLISAKNVLGAMGQRAYIPGQSKLNHKQFGGTNDPAANFRYMKALNDLRNAQEPGNPQAVAPTPQGPTTVDDPLISAKHVLGEMGKRAYVPGQSQLNVKQFGGTNDPDANFKHMNALNELRNKQGQGNPPQPMETAQGAETVDDPLISAKLALGEMGKRAHVPGQSQLNVNQFGGTNDPDANFKHMNALNELRNKQGQRNQPGPAVTAQGAETVDDPLVTAKLAMGAKGQRAYVPGQSQLNVKEFGKTDDPDANVRHMNALDELRKRDN